ncbi:hypothetical protein D3C78_1124920 [compost metagenome]
MFGEWFVRRFEDFVVDQHGVDHTGQVVDRFEGGKNLCFLCGLKDHHQLALRAFLMHFEVGQQLQVGLHCRQRLGAGMHDQAGDLDAVRHRLGPL